MPKFHKEPHKELILKSHEEGEKNIPLPPNFNEIFEEWKRRIEMGKPIFGLSQFAFIANGKDPERIKDSYPGWQNNHFQLLLERLGREDLISSVKKGLEQEEGANDSYELVLSPEQIATIDRLKGKILTMSPEELLRFLEEIAKKARLDVPEEAERRFDKNLNPRKIEGEIRATVFSVLKETAEQQL